ncbi:MAG: hypothetical protein U9N34_07650 [Candidatus Cloacimonadota bacterium]|nr:hypothetical protein [Candidatus Cloacimonadota bacterium]
MKYFKIILLVAIIFTMFSCDNRNANLPEMSFIYDDSQLYNYQNHNFIDVTASLDAVNSFISEKKINLEYNSDYVTVDTHTGDNKFIRTDSLGYATFQVIIQDDADNYGHIPIEFQMDDYHSVEETLSLDVKDMPKITTIDYAPSMFQGASQTIKVTFFSQTGDAINQSVSIIPDIGNVNYSPILTDDEGVIEFVFTAPSIEVDIAEIEIYLDEFTDGYGEPDISQRLTININ